MVWWGWVLAVIGALVMLALVVNAKDITRYRRIRKM